MLYKKVSTSLNFVDREKEVLKFWQDNDVFGKSIENREGCPTYTFYDGPPTANGKPHIGHVLTRAVKDIIPRYRTMKGYKVLRKAGWDTHGLPVELEVEKALGLDGKPQIEAYGVEPFIAKCKESVWTYKSQWEDISERVGFWADMENPYITYDNNYIESIWWSLKEIFNKDLLYQGHKVLPYCPRCGTALSSHEVAQGYEDVTDTSVIARFKVSGEENTYILAWTTTPWTLPSNLALCVNADSEYARLTNNGNTYIMAKALVDDVIEGEYEILDTCSGADLVGTAYEPLFPGKGSAVPEGQINRVVADSYVTLTDGTGIVHLAPFGEDDMRLLIKNKLKFELIVDSEGKFTEGTPWEGMFVKDADHEIIHSLEHLGLLHKAEDFDHSYPFCWRCDTPLLYYPRGGWFIAMTKMKQQLLASNNSVNWMPDNIKEGRMGNFLENVVDWALSRERYWGTPLPVWVCECGHQHAIGSIAELQELGTDVPDDIELHKPFIDRITIKCTECGADMHRTPEVIDCWYDSGSMPFAQFHYPFENKELFDDNFPADFISEAIDQTRGWFYSLMAISTVLFGKSSYKNCLVLGHVNDKEGRKMSKHIGNTVDPWEVLDKQGADAVRWYFYTGSSPWLPSRFSDEAVSEGQRKFMGTLWNTYAFYMLYANIDNFNPTEYSLDYDKLPVMDKWVLSRLNTLVKTVDECMDRYAITEAGRAMSVFVDELSNWYVRRGRSRYWASDMEQDKINAYMTLYTVLDTVAKLAAPFTPFMAEAIYTNLVTTVDKDAPISIHMADFPEYHEEMVDLDLEKYMGEVLEVVTLGRACRNVAAVKNRQPVQKLYVQGVSLPESYSNIVRDELNVKVVEKTESASDFVDYIIKPQMRTLGPKYGRLLNNIRTALAESDGIALVAELDEKGVVEFDFDGTNVELTREDMLIETTQRSGFYSQSQGDVTVVLDSNLTPELIEEGFVREVISKVQNLRKEAGFEVTDHIMFDYSGDAEGVDIIDKNAEFIGLEVLADSMQSDVSDGYTQELKVNDKVMTFTLKKLG